MFLARVIGAVVATKKDELMKGHKLLLLRPLLVDEANPAKLRPGNNTIVAVDRLGAGLDEVVLFCQGSSARQASGMKTLPVDAVIVGIVDTVDVLNKKVYPEAPPAK
jgi:ethanolamine utilization protein EutN